MLHKTVKAQRNTACYTIVSHVRIIIDSTEKIEKFNKSYSTILLLLCANTSYRKITSHSEIICFQYYLEKIISESQVILFTYFFL